MTRSRKPYHFLQLPNYFRCIRWKAALSLGTWIRHPYFRRFFLRLTNCQKGEMGFFVPTLFSRYEQLKSVEGWQFSYWAVSRRLSYSNRILPWSLSIWRPRGTKWWQCRLLVWSSRLTAFERLLRPQKRSAAQEEDASSLLGNDVRRWPCFFFEDVVVVVSSGRLYSSSYLLHWRWCGENVCVPVSHLTFKGQFIQKSRENSSSSGTCFPNHVIPFSANYEPNYPKENFLYFFDHNWIPKYVKK